VSDVRVLVVLPGVGPEGGAEQSFVAIAPTLIASGTDLHLAVLSDYQTSVPALERVGVVIHDLSAHTGAPSRSRGLRHLVRTIRPDIVHATLWDATLPTQVAMIASSVPVLITWAVTPAARTARLEAPSLRRKQQVMLLIDAALGRLCGARYHAVTAGVGAAMASAMWVDSERVLVGERGRADPEPHDGKECGDLKSTLGLSAGEKLVLAIGRQDVQKGYATLLDQFDELAADRPGVHLAIAGRPGGATRALEVQREMLSQSDRIHFLGHRDDVAELLRSADIVVCSSWREGAAGALIEAMACARPIVSVRLEGLEGVLEDRRNALVVQRESLAAGLRDLLDHPQLAQRLAVGARRTYEERFTLDRSADRLIDIYRQLAAGSA
jgi:glycosyltransferase involved in cell wall biosynthesis